MLIELAGIPAEVICRYPENEVFLSDYRTERPPLITIRPDDEDLRRIQSGFDRVAVLNGGEPQPLPPAFLENNAIHALLAESLVAYDVLLMHGSALCMDGEAYVFTARSGTGKSTHARLWREAFGDRVWMINDDKPLLRILPDEVRVYGTPWAGKHRLSRNAYAPLRAIILLDRATENSMSVLSGAEAFQTLLSSAYASVHPATSLRIMTIERTVANSADFYHLCCTPDISSAYFARTYMQRHSGRAG